MIPEPSNPYYLICLVPLCLQDRCQAVLTALGGDKVWLAHLDLLRARPAPNLAKASLFGIEL